PCDYGVMTYKLKMIRISRLYVFIATKKNLDWKKRELGNKKHKETRMNVIPFWVREPYRLPHPKR
ncbi:MAG: hypothetical protein DRQ61_12060, partial [Gammaproteobacteria bacterium]